MVWVLLRYARAVALREFLLSGRWSSEDKRLTLAFAGAAMSLPVLVLSPAPNIQLFRASVAQAARDARTDTEAHFAP